MRPHLTDRIASLCISCPLQAGIISFNTPNSSFIFDRLLLSIRLCAVFLAILRPAAVVPALDFLFPPAAAGVLAAVGACAAASTSGFIWMIFLDLVGGGGRVKSSLVITRPDPDSTGAAAAGFLRDVSPE